MDRPLARTYTTSQAAAMGYQYKQVAGSQAPPGRPILNEGGPAFATPGNYFDPAENKWADYGGEYKENVEMPDYEPSPLRYGGSMEATFAEDLQRQQTMKKLKTAARLFEEYKDSKHTKGIGAFGKPLSKVTSISDEGLPNVGLFMLPPRVTKSRKQRGGWCC
eukprot:GHVQ01033486.1.p1 GENE.GHVQ01033486.1~~GHVQ01033486.1.p1  ORF type:complete len:163 (+),score=17.64 GHVQ01033486.1:150-638(+)